MLKKFTAIDFEMPDNLDRRISALGITVVENGEITKSFYSLVNPQVPFTPFIEKLTGINSEKVKNAPVFPDVWDIIRPMLEDSIIVAHSAGNDLKVLSNCLKHYKIQWKTEVPFLCTFELGKICFPNNTSLGLATVCGEFGISLDHHNALSDCEASARILLEYEKRGIDAISRVQCYDLINGNKKSENSRSMQEYKHIISALYELKTEKCKAEYIEAYPHISPDTILGIPEKNLEEFARKLQMSRKYKSFISHLPHDFFEENLLHAMLISMPVKRRKKSILIDNIRLADEFLPYVDSVEVLKMIKPKLFARRGEIMRENILCWAKSDNKFTFIFAVYSCISFCIDSPWITEIFPLTQRNDISDKDVKNAIIDLFHSMAVFSPKKTIRYLKENKLTDIIAEPLRNLILTDERIDEKFKTAFKNEL